MRTLIVLVGVQGSGKTTLLEGLEHVSVLKPSTTRPQRDVTETEYYFETEAWVHENYAWTINFRNHNYGMRLSELEAIRDVGVTVFEPSNLATLRGAPACQNFEIVTVGLDTIADIAEQEARVGGDGGRKASKSQLEVELKDVRQCDVVLSGSQDVVREAFVELVKLLGGRGGVLGKTSISSLISAGTLLKNVAYENIEAASYDLRLADTYWCQGDFHNLSSEKLTAEIPPYSFVIVQAVEEAALPRFITATFDIRVRLFFSGVILSNGPQVDPGYRGSLFCMLYNASGTAVGLTRGQHFATIQFQTLSSNSTGYDALYQGKVNFIDFFNGSDSIKKGGQIVEYIDKKYTSIETGYKESRNYFLGVVTLVISVVLAVAAMAYSQIDKMGAATDKANAAAEKVNTSIDTANKKAI